MFDLNLFLFDILLLMAVSFLLHISIVLLYLFDFKLNLNVFLWLIFGLLFILCLRMLSINTFILLIFGVLCILCFYMPETPKLDGNVKLLTSSTGPILYISTSYLVGFVIINMILNLTVSVLAGTPTDVTTTLTENYAIPTSQALLSQYSSIMSTPMTCVSPQYLIHDVIIWAVDTGIIGMFEIPSTTPIPTVTSTITSTATVTNTITSVSTSTIIQPLTGALFGNNLWTGLIYLLTGLGSLTFNFLSSLLCGTHVGLGCVLNLTLGSQFTQFMSNIGYSYLLSIPPIAVFSILLSIIIGAWTFVIILRPEGSSPIIAALRRIRDVIIKVIYDIICFLFRFIYYLILRFFRW